MTTKIGHNTVLFIPDTLLREKQIMNSSDQSNFELISEIIQAVRYMNTGNYDQSKVISTQDFQTKVVNYLKNKARLIMERTLSKL